VTLSGRPDSPLREGARPTAARLALTANAAYDLLSVLDQPDSIPGPDAGLALAGRLVRPTVVRVCLLLLALPILVLAVDAVARLRRTRTTFRVGARSTALRAVTPLVILATAHLVTLVGLWPGTAAGWLPLPSSAGFGWAALLGTAVVVGVAVISRWAVRRRLDVLRAPVAAEGTAGLVLFAALLVVLWLVSPFALVLALPAGHALLVASVARRPWHVWAAIGVAVLPFVALAASVAGTLDSNVLFAAWYLVETTASGARGATGPLLAALIVGCLWAMAAFAMHHARTHALPEGAAPPRRRRPRLKLRIERTPVRRRR